MSMHEIESLAENSILFINKLKISQQEKRTLFYNIYNWQSIFDTSYTHFRVKEILEENNFLYSITLKEFQEHRILSKEELLKIEQENNLWIESFANNEVIYADWNNGDIKFYFDYGSKTWDFLVKKNNIKETNQVEEWEAIILIQKISLLAFQNDNNNLVCEWYAVLINSIYEEEIEWNYTFKKALIELPITTLKENAFQADYSKYKSYDGLLEKQNWNDLKDDLNEEEDNFYLFKYLTNVRQTQESALKAYERHLKTPKLPTTVIKDELATFFDKSEWVLKENKEDNYIQWIWYKDINSELGEHHIDFKRYIFSFEYQLNDAFLFINQGLQMGKFLKWQNASANYKEYSWHFRQSFIASLPPDELDSNKLINDWGAWHIPLKKKESFIKKRTDNIIENLSKHIDNYFIDTVRSFEENNYFNQNIDDLIHNFLNGDEHGNIPENMLFDHPLSIYFAFIFQAIEDGKTEESEILIKKAKTYLEDKQNILSLNFLPILKQLEQKEEVNYPMHIHPPFLKYLKMKN